MGRQSNVARIRPVLRTPNILSYPIFSGLLAGVRTVRITIFLRVRCPVITHEPPYLSRDPIAGVDLVDFDLPGVLLRRCAR